MLSPELIKQIKHLELKAHYLVSEALSGEYLSAFKGSGIEFEKIREYTEGDDIRTIDWNVTARMNHPFVKVYHEERELSLMLAIDVSASQFFGTQGRFKQEVAVELGALIAYLAIKNNDKVGLLLFTDKVELYLPPKKGRGHIWNMIKEILTFKPNGVKTDLNEVCSFINRVLHRRTTCFLISDFIDFTPHKSLRTLSKKHDLTLVQTIDLREQELVSCGIIRVLDQETNEVLSLDTSDPEVLKNYASFVKQEEKNLLDFVKKSNSHHFVLTSKGPLVEPLMNYLRCREHKRKSGL